MENLLNDLEQFTGTSKYYNLGFGLKATEGIKYLADTAKCYWLLDVVASYQKRLKDYPFQIWQIVVKNKKAVVSCKEDTDMPNLVIQAIKYTDFPLDVFEFYCIDGIILLKSEY
jgi:hypothetical protein